MKIEENHYNYRIETKDPNGGSLDFIDIDTVEPLRCAYDVQDELNLETNEHIKRVEEIVLDANSTEFWYVDEARTSDTHLVCYFEEVQLMAHKDHPMVDTDRSIFEYGKINSNEHQDTNFICTHVMDNGVSRIYMSIDKETFEFATFNNETIKQFISMNPVTVWYALRYEVIIPRSLSKGHLLTLGGQTDITLTTNNEQAKLPIMKFNIGDTQYTLDTNPIHINNTQEGTQIRNIVLEGNTPINYARGNGVNTTEAISDTRYDFEPFYDGQATIQGTVEGGYVSAKLYGDTMVNIAKPYGESPLLTATNESTLCDDLLGTNEEGIVLADGEITEGRIYGNSLINMLESCSYSQTQNGSSTLDGEYAKITSVEVVEVASVLVRLNTPILKASTTYYIKYLHGQGDKISEQTMNSLLRDTQNGFNYEYGLDYTWDYENQIFALTPSQDTNCVTIYIKQPLNSMVRVSNCVYITDDLEKAKSYNIKDGFNGIGSVVNPTVYSVNENLVNPSLFRKGINITLIDGGVMVDGDTSVGWQSFYNNTTAIKLLANHTYKLRAFLLEGEYTGGNFKYTLSNNTAKETPYTNTFTITPTTDAYLTALSFYAPSGVGAKFGISLIETDGELDTYIPYKSSQFTSTHTLNKLPNGVADYIDVVNKVHVQRVYKIVLNGSENWIKQHNITDYTLFSYILPTLPIDTSVRLNCMICDKINVENYQNLQAQAREFITIRNSTTKQLLLNLSNSKASDVTAIQTYLASNPITVLYELATPVYTPLTEEEIAQLPLSAYKDGYVNLSSDQLMPSFEFRMRASNRYQVDMLETGYYYLNAPVGNVKLGTASVDVQQMPCIVKVDNVGTGDSGYRLGLSNELRESIIELTFGGYFNTSNGEVVTSSSDAYTPEYLSFKDYGLTTRFGFTSCEDTVESGYGNIVLLYNEEKQQIGAYASETVLVNCDIPTDAKYFRVSIRTRNSDNPKAKIVNTFTTLAKLPSHRIPTSFTQGMKCTINYLGYWQGDIGARPIMFRTSNIDDAWKIVESSVIEDGNGIVLNRIEISSMSLIIEDELDIATGKFTKRVGKVVLDGSSDESWSISTKETSFVKTKTFQVSLPTKSRENYICINNRIPYDVGWEKDFERLWIDNRDTLVVHTDKAFTIDSFRQYLASNPITVYYPLEVPEISYPKISSTQVKTVAKTALQCLRWENGYLNAQVKPSHLTYPVPSLVGNRTYTVIHNRKNITGSTKPIELNLGGTVVQLNDASSKTLVKTPSTLAHSNLIFIGGESTVDHVMVLDGDWTNKPIEYFENMMGHDTDAIITIIGNGQINGVEEQYLW